MREGLLKFSEFWNKLIIKVSETLLFIASLSFVISINIAIVSRMFDFPVSWVEDYCRFVQVWVTMLGLSCAVHSHGVPAVELLVLYVPKKIKLIINALIDIFIIIVCAVLINSSHALIQLMGSMTIASMDFLDMKYFYLAIPVCGGLIIFFSIQRLIFRALGIDVDTKEVSE